MERLADFMKIQRENVSVDNVSYYNENAEANKVYLSQWKSQLQVAIKYPPESFDCLQALVPALIGLRTKYFNTIADKSPDRAIYIQFPTDEAQVKCVSKLLKKLQKKQAPDDEDFKTMMIVPLPGDFIPKIARDMSRFKDLLTQRNTIKGTNAIIVFLASPMKGKEDILNHMIISPPDAETPEELNKPELAAKTLTAIKESNICGNCKKKDEKSFKRCGTCHFIRYCSVECQRQNWHIHKEFCPALAQMKMGIDLIAKGEG